MVLVEYKGYLTVPDIPEDIIQEWAETLKAERIRMYQHLIEKIPDEQAFKNIIATRASDAWSAFINPSWEDAEFIKLKHRIKLMGSYQAWKSGIDNAFDGDNPYFDDRVEEKKTKYTNVRPVLGIVGYKPVFGRGIAVKAIGVISGDYRVLYDIGGDDELSGTVVNVFPTGVAKYARATAVPIIVKGLTLGYYALTIGDTSMLSDIINAVNQILSNSVIKMVDTSKYTASMDIGYDTNKAKLYVHSVADQVQGGG